MNLTTTLVVDDSLFMRRVIGEAIADIGCNDIHFAKDGIEAVKIATALKPDLVTLNITMPNMNGMDAIEKILEISPASKIVMISAMHDQKTIQRAKEKGSIDYIVKPFEKTSLENVLKDHFEY
ncbi:MAG: response regulator [Firmicutes bacterium]|nr:response regulator [Bacillota bacterium]